MVYCSLGCLRWDLHPSWYFPYPRLGKVEVLLPLFADTTLSAPPYLQNIIPQEVPTAWSDSSRFSRILFSIRATIAPQDSQTVGSDTIGGEHQRLQSHLVQWYVHYQRKTLGWTNKLVPKIMRVKLMEKWFRVFSLWLNLTFTSSTSLNKFIADSMNYRRNTQSYSELPSS
jgi:hypothetical protein